MDNNLPGKKKTSNGKRFGYEQPAIAGPGRPRLSEEVKNARRDARMLLKEKAYWMAGRIIELSGHEDPDVAIKALKVGIDKVLPNLEEVDNFEHRPLENFNDEQLTIKLKELESDSGNPMGTGKAA